MSARSNTHVYATREASPPVHKPDIDTRMNALIGLIAGKYAPLADASLGQSVAYLGNGVPQWKDVRKAALMRARQRRQRTRVDGVD